MSVSLIISTEGELVLYKETVNKQTFMKLQKEEVDSLFFFLIKRKKELIAEIKDINLKNQILQILLEKEKENGI